MSLPRSPAGTIALTCVVAVALVAAAVYLFGWPLTVGIVVMGAAAVARCTLSSGWWRTRP